METSTTALLVLSLIGTFAFGISGALAAVRAELDLFGVTVVAAATGLAGGILRDVLLGLQPTALRDWRFVAVVVGAAGLAILARPMLERSRRAMELAEAAGLGFVCVAGTLDALHHHSGPVEAVMLGALTGIGGGVVRDLLLGDPPVVLRRGFYAVPALIGSLVYTSAHEVGAGGPAAAIIAVAACFGLRLLGISKAINLPQAGPPQPGEYGDEDPGKTRSHGTT
jgi:uncharacterized membrane protein YeiH